MLVMNIYFCIVGETALIYGTTIFTFHPLFKCVWVYGSAALGGNKYISNSVFTAIYDFLWQNSVSDTERKFHCEQEPTAPIY